MWLPLSDVTPRSEALYEQAKKQIEEDARDSKYPPGLLEQYNIQLGRIQNGGLEYEFIVTPTFRDVDS